MTNKLSIYPLNFQQNKFVSRKNTPIFKGLSNIETLTHTNIGNCPKGYIGKVKVRKATGEECFLNVNKRLECESEIYEIKDDFNNLIGQTEIKIRKYMQNSYWDDVENKSHVFINELRNFSKPKTPYHNNHLPYYKDIGTRLMQIAQRRSDESGCNGNIKLIAKEESKPYYLNIIHMKEEFPEGSPLRKYNNPNILYLPAEAKENLSKIQGGL